MLLITLTGVLIFVLSTGSVVFAARLGSPPDYLAALRFTDCKIPCWIGIVPGKTTLRDAQQIIMAAFANSRIYTASQYPISPPMELAFALQNPPNPPDVISVNVWIEIKLDAQTDDIVDTIRFTFSEHSTVPMPRITVGVLHSLFGSPSGIALAELAGNRFDFPAVIYGDDVHGGAAIFARDIFPLQHQVIRRYDLDQPVRMLELFSAGNSPITASWRPRTWRGFTWLTRY